MQGIAAHAPGLVQFQPVRKLAFILRSQSKGDVMETLLIFAAIGWAITGINLLLTWEDNPEVTVRRIQDA
jgi:hypothetical protein